MATTLQLLAMPHIQALKTMISDELVGASYNDLHVEDGYIRSDMRSGYLIKSHPDKATDSSWNYHGSVVFTHYRVRLQDVFYGIPLRLKVPNDGNGGISTSTGHVVSLISSIFDLHFEPTDYFNDAIVAEDMVTYTLKTTPSSLRWSGSIDIDLYPED